MNGIIFFGTNIIEELERFYIDKIGCEIWLRQADCVVFKFGNMVFGFCQRNKSEADGILCFVLQDRAEVDDCHAILSAIADANPKLNEKYNIYHFFARDPEGRKIEFQSFEKPMIF